VPFPGVNTTCKNWKSFLQKIYSAFNARDIDRTLAAMHEHVDWPNGWEAGAYSDAMGFVIIGGTSGK
jgi:hypothetical protein